MTLEGALIPACAPPLDIIPGVQQLPDSRRWRVTLVGGCWHLNEYHDGDTPAKAIAKAIRSIELWKEVGGNGEAWAKQRKGRVA
jgi:hypothetical protein